LACGGLANFSGKEISKSRNIYRLGASSNPQPMLLMEVFRMSEKKDSNFAVILNIRQSANVPAWQRKAWGEFLDMLQERALKCLQEEEKEKGNH
jgi:hypothetical protein